MPNGRSGSFSRLPLSCFPAPDHPWLYTWRNRSKFYRWYRELKYLESEVSDHPHPEQIPDYRVRLDRIEDAVNKVNVPLAFYDEIYTLREHIDFVRGKISRLNQDSY